MKRFKEFQVGDTELDASKFPKVKVLRYLYLKMDDATFHSRLI